METKFDLKAELEAFQDLGWWRRLTESQLDKWTDCLDGLEDCYKRGLYPSENERAISDLLANARAYCKERTDAPCFITAYWRRCDSNAEVKEVEELFEFAHEDDGDAYRSFGKHLIESAGWEAFGVSFATEEVKRDFIRCFSYTEWAFLHVDGYKKPFFTFIDEGWVYFYANKE